MTPQERILHDVIAERQRQDAKFGPVPRLHHGPLLWQTILSEEVGEVARAILDGRAASGISAAAGDGDPWPTDAEGLKQLRAELVQVAAVAVCILEHLDSKAAAEAAIEAA